MRCQMSNRLRWLFCCSSAAVISCLVGGGFEAAAARDSGPTMLEGVPRYDNIVVIEMENRQYGEIIDAAPSSSPHMTALARRFNSATRYFAITHPSEPNYIAMVAGDQEGILDDDAWYCEADGSMLARDKAIVAGAPNGGDMSRPCSGHAKRPAAYVAHHFTVPNLFAQLNKAGISWAMFNQSMPIDPRTGTGIPETPIYPTEEQNADIHNLYASKHNPSVNFDDIRSAPDFHTHNLTADAFLSQVAAGTLPGFSYVVPDQCHDDHGPSGPMTTRPECRGRGYGPSPLLATGDSYVGMLVDRIRASPLWTSKRNVAVFVTFDEDDSGGAGVQGCCGYHPVAQDGPHKGMLNQGGGRIPMIVITNHGVTGVQDDTAYNHYALLRTVEDAFGIGEHIGRASLQVPTQPADGSFVQTPVLPMTPMLRIANPSIVN